MAQLTLKPIWHDKLTIIEKNDPVEGGVDGIDNKPHIELAQNSAYLKQEIDNLETKTDNLEQNLEEQQTKLDTTAKNLTGNITPDDGDVTLKSLLERIKELESNANKIPIGTLVASKIHYETGGDFAQAMGYGVWERALQGRVPVGFSGIVSDPEEFRTAGAEYGEFTHTLTTAELPEHKHSANDVYNKFSARAIDVTEESWKTKAMITQHQDAVQLLADEWQTTGSSQAGWLAATELSVGETQPHNNQPPSRTIDWWERVA